MGSLRLRRIAPSSHARGEVTARAIHFKAEYGTKKRRENHSQSRGHLHQEASLTAYGEAIWRQMDILRALEGSWAPIASILCKLGVMSSWIRIALQVEVIVQPMLRAIDT